MFTLTDASGVALATLLAGVAIALPGVALARAFGLARRDSLVVGLAALPLLDSLLARGLGLDAALAATLALAAAGGALLMAARGSLQVSRTGLALCAIWLALVVFEWVDIDVAGRLFQPFTVIDTVKHAATAQAIVDSGVPPRDPFFLRPQRVSYYYFFYMLPALIERLGCGLVDARAAVGGCVVWVGLGLYALVGLALERIGAAATPVRRTLTIALLAAGGLDVLGVLFLGLVGNLWIADPVIWNEQVAGWFESLLWVPHHVTALIAAMLGLMALASVVPAGDSAETTSRGRRARGVGLAAICFASTLGLSVWLALGLVGTAALWAVVLVVERRWRALGLLALAGLGALVLAVPQMHDLVAGRAATASAAIAPTVRAFFFTDWLIAPGPLRLLARFVALPLNYLFGFGVLAAGAVLYWRRGGTGVGAMEVVCRLGLAALSGLMLGGFLRSTLFNNDLGWRVVLFPLLAGLVWTIAVVERGPARAWHRRVSPVVMALFLLGIATTAVTIAGQRAYPVMTNVPQAAFLSAEPETERAMRIAYAWADAHLPPGAVLQHNPTRSRALAFALYGRHPVAVADRYGSLFGADPKAVYARIAALAPIFAGGLAPEAVRARALSAGIDELVVSAADPVWRQPKSFVWQAAPAYASARVRILPVAALAGTSEAPVAPPASTVAASDPGHGG